MIIESIGNGYYAGIMKNLDLIVVRKTEQVMNELWFIKQETNPRLEIIKKLSEVAFF